MPKADCPFCAQLSNCKDNDEYYHRDNYRVEYRAALDTAHYYAPPFGDEWCTGGATYGGFPLNFCPSCGRPLNN